VYIYSSFPRAAGDTGRGPRLGSDLDGESGAGRLDSLETRSRTVRDRPSCIRIHVNNLKGGIGIHEVRAYRPSVLSEHRIGDAALVLSCLDFSALQVGLSGL
jgi:hypothetical protein